MPQHGKKSQRRQHGPAGDQPASGSASNEKQSSQKPSHPQVPPSKNQTSSAWGPPSSAKPQTRAPGPAVSSGLAQHTQAHNSSSSDASAAGSRAHVRVGGDRGLDMKNTEAEDAHEQKDNTSGTSPPPARWKEEEILRASFNQDRTCITVSSASGFHVYGWKPFGRLFSFSQGGVAVAETLNGTSLALIAGSGHTPSLSPRRVLAFNMAEQKFICQLNFVSTVLNVCVNRRRTVVVRESHIHIIDTPSMKILHTLKTPPNPSGLCALSPCSETDRHCYVAYPNTADKGEIMLFDALHLQVTSVVIAHDNPLQVLSFNRNGTMLASASTKGTVVRVFDVPSGRKTHTFRRGTRSVTIHSIDFDPSSSLIALTSDSSTVHVFDLAGRAAPPPSTSTGAAVLAARNAVSNMLPLPAAIHDIVEPSRAFAHVNLKDIEPALCALPSDVELVVLTSKGHLYSYSIPHDGGVCRLASEHSLGNDLSDALGAQVHSAEQPSEH